MHRQMVFKFRLHLELSLEFGKVFLCAVIVRFGSLADMAASFDHLVGAHK
jgi:hypothetical protein